MPHLEFYELPPEAKDTLSRLRWQIAGNRMLLAWYRIETLLRKANFNPNQPRVPAGSGQESGRWTGSGAHSYGGVKGDSFPLLTVQGKSLTSHHIFLPSGQTQDVFGTQSSKGPFDILLALPVSVRA